ncbi:MAG: hypothetical protein JSS66_06865 [Armatimonadetes bacterium]|nr:hypothetical protein [Armatimonadota bacterium]
MQFTIVKNQDTEHLDELLLDADGFCQPLPAARLQELDYEAFRIWCGRNAVYTFPTLELVEHLRGLINGRRALEVGAGNGHLGRLLGVPMTDSAMQTEPGIAAHYRTIGQAPTNPPADVERIDAEAAVAKYRPQVVLASWLTHKWEPGMTEGNEFGPDERNIIGQVETYIHIGNDRVHSQKPAWVLPHNKAWHPWLVTRAGAPEKNHIAVWGTLLS